MQANIFKIKRNELADGSGLRTTIYFKGCPLRCVWCSTPQAHERPTQILWDSKHCLYCNLCVSECPTGSLAFSDNRLTFTPDTCTFCRACTDHCPSRMLHFVGQMMNMGMEFATASLHNSFYFVEAKNIIHDRPMVAKNFENLVNELLRSNSPKKWFRAYFNHGLINYIYGQKRLLPCDMSFDTFFIDPYGDVMPCNGTKDKEVMGNLNNQTWDELWNSPEAEKVRAKVRCCDRDCWMIGSVSPAMHKYIWKPATWVLVHKFKALFTKHPYSMYELKICRDYRDGKVTKEDLDKCSTCDMNCVINNGLSEASKEQLKHKTGEEIVDADIAQQMETK